MLFKITSCSNKNRINQLKIKILPHKKPFFSLPKFELPNSRCHSYVCFYVQLKQFEILRG